MISTAIFTCVTFARGWFPKWALVAGAVIATIAAFPIYLTYQHRVAEDDNGSAAARIHLAKIAWELIGDQPFFGVGAGNYYTSVEAFSDGSPYRSEWAYTVHCDYLLVWAESGVFGLCAYVAFFLTTIYRGWKVWKVGDPLLSILALAIAAATIGLMVHMVVDLFNARPALQLTMCCAGLIFAMQRMCAVVDSRAAAPVGIPITKLKHVTA
jgi:O-antigen ligase